MFSFCLPGQTVQWKVRYCALGVEHSLRMFHAIGLGATNGVQHFFSALLWEDLGLTGKVKVVSMPA